MKNYTFEEVFHEENLNTYSYSGTANRPFKFDDSRNRIHGEIELEHVGKRLAMSERYSGAGLKRCVLVMNGDVASRKRVGTGKCFVNNLRIKVEDVGPFYIEYQFLNSDSNQESALEIVCR